MTVDGHAVDRFELTRQERSQARRREAKDAIVTAVRDGVTPKRRGVVMLGRRR